MRAKSRVFASEGNLAALPLRIRSTKDDSSIIVVGELNLSKKEMLGVMEKSYDGGDLKITLCPLTGVDKHGSCDKKRVGLVKHPKFRSPRSVWWTSLSIFDLVGVGDWSHGLDRMRKEDTDVSQLRIMIFRRGTSEV